MGKKILAVVLILLAGGGWFYADYKNKLEQAEMEQMQRDLNEARARATAMAAAKAKFEAQIQADLTTCRTTAEKAKEDFLEANKKPVKRKPGEFTIPQTAIDEAAKTLEAANAACQTTHDTRFGNGM